ncbi:hypothetical protein GGR56DRAFT_626720 [Xylariaceae sp. FL0804]|nr:hypothetical protein GGR56DRAFT_626720 [Xylariaceae sp. FL0804]
MAQKFKDIAKNGWHPEQDGSSLRDQVKSLVGKGDKSDAREGHSAPPISSLRDPSSFGPPPKRTGLATTAPAAHVPSAHAPAAPPSPSPSRYQTKPYIAPGALPPRQPTQQSSPPPPPPPLPAQSGEEEAAPTPKPFRIDTTGLSTAGLPPPPVRRGDASSSGGAAAAAAASPPPPYSPAATTAAAAAKKAPPPVPPRLPARDVTQKSSGGGGFLNQGAADRLGVAGISVPGLGIGRSSAGAIPGGGAAATTTPPAPPPRAGPAASAADGLRLVQRLGEGTPGCGVVGSSSPRPSPGAPVAFGPGKAAPPPPKKKAGLSAAAPPAADPSSPPPVPLASKPTFR